MLMMLSTNDSVRPLLCRQEAKDKPNLCLSKIRWRVATAIGRAGKCRM